MNMMSKLAGLAQKALDKNGQTTPGSSAGGTDWRSMVRSAADAITGDGQAQAGPPVQPRASAPASAPVSDADRAAIARYDYLMETADPRQIEQVHREAFDRLSPEQRGVIQQRMNDELPDHERPRSASADDLARTAARTEASRPGMLRGLLARATGQGSAGAGRAAMIGGAGLAAGGVLAAVAGGAVVSSVAGPLLEQATSLGVDFESLANGLDLGAITGIDELATGAGEAVSGFGDQLGELGSNFEIPGIGDFFGR